MGALLLMGGAQAANAQYYEIASQLPGLLQPALSGSLAYKGYVEASGLAGIGNNRANFIGVSTSQGFKYADWFFMGVGVGVDAAFVRSDGDYFADIAPDERPDYWGHSSSRTKCMIPVFTDFRFNIGDTQSVCAYIDLKLGAAWLIGDSYLRLNNGAYLSTATQFYMRPSVGVRIPVNKSKPAQAVNIGVTYQLLTSNNNYYWNDNSVTLSNLGVTVGYEW